MIPDLSSATWRKSSYSGGGANDCAEVADGYPGVVPVRDSKGRPVGLWSSALWPGPHSYVV
ncbi:DUF397 domain-containing protein [Streptomyces achromogenes]|uniref:DUF397 domain-containing protein n=1 Tax=Streptomyces achromogenes TaxID=67255 RepID=UPI003F4E2E4A